MLLVSWVENSLATSDSHTVTLYRSEPDYYTILGMDSTVHNHYDFTSLDSCSPYMTCVEIAGSHSVICLSAITGMTDDSHSSHK